MIKFLIVVCTVLLIFSCSKSEDRYSYWGNQSDDVLKPFYYYNTWTYVDTVFTPPLEVYETKLQITGSRVYDVEGEKKRLFFWNWYNVETGKPTNQISLMRNEEEGLYFYGQIYQGLTSAINKRLFLEFPTETGNTWPYIMSNIYEVETMAVKDTIDTFYGEMEVIRYRVYDTSGRSLSEDFTKIFGLPTSLFNRDDGLNAENIYLYYKPGLGYVAMKSYNNGFLIHKKVLKDYVIFEK